MNWTTLITEIFHGFIAVGVAYISIKAQKQDKRNGDQDKHNGAVNKRLDNLEDKS